jgi:hypothetical protein
MNTYDRWRTSSYSGSANNCVEVALTKTGAKVRDTKDRASGHLELSPAGFRGLVQAVQGIN